MGQQTISTSEREVRIIHAKAEHAYPRSRKPPGGRGHFFHGSFRFDERLFGESSLSDEKVAFHRSYPNVLES
jgi:hypothetical protein